MVKLVNIKSKGETMFTFGIKAIVNVLNEY
jgi:hypothetical protein